MPTAWRCEIQLRSGCAAFGLHFMETMPVTIGLPDMDEKDVRDKNIRSVALQIVHERFPSADAVLLCGSVVRGEGTPTSDLDLVVLFDHVDAAWRESFVHADWPIECFCHDEETMEYYFTELDRPSGIGVFLHMVLDGIALPNETALSRRVRSRAQAVHDQGPTPWGAPELEYSRYNISGLMDDLRGARSQAELNGIATLLYAVLAQHVFRSRGCWSAHGKTILPRLRKLDIALAQQFESAFTAVFVEAEAGALLSLCAAVLAPAGGYLFAGYRPPVKPEQRKPVLT